MPQSEFNLRLIEEFRANGGESVSGRFQGAMLLLLTTTSRKSGELWTTPVGYWMDGEHMYIHTVNAGRPKIPHWYFNLVATPAVTLEVGQETYRARAVDVGEEESERRLAQLADREPRFQAVLARMTAEAAPRPRRRIPIVWVERL
jgi:deazaflavin-dependent oxidoreductase (nitroreductase family)